ncbi:MAG TPA: efflux RND transporter periplasmic adaptor subunit [Bryobacteraceae bacterium]|nr:efflux RND transporter periplasmic adaptor subunit [Bryobacteraceae bacterium]
MVRRTKVLIAIAGLALFLGTGAWALLRGQGGVQYRTAPVDYGTVADAVSATGTPNAVVTVQVGSQVSGNISELDADFNSKVTKNQVVARIDPQEFQARVDQAKATLNAAQASVGNAQAQMEKNQADVASAQAAVANAKAAALKAQSATSDAKSKMDRRVELVNEGVMSKEDGETAQTTYAQAAAELDSANAQIVAAQDSVSSAQAQVKVDQALINSAQAMVKEDQAGLEQAQADLDHTYIRTPVTGVVVARNIDVGQTVAASLQAPTLFQIAEDLTKMQVDTNVSEADVGRVKVGMPATFTVDAYPGQVFHGTVTSIREAPINVQNVITYDAVISVANPDLKLFPGMTANVKILVEQHDSVLKVPNAALRYRPTDAPAAGKRKASANQSTLYVLDASGHPKPVQVTLGITDGSYTEVTGGGLQQGDRVITASLSSKPATTSSAAATPFGGSSGGRGGPRI